MPLQFTGSRDKALETKDDDRLALKYYADGLAGFIGSCQTPMTIGVQGEWGSGKTSLMRLVQAEVRRRSQDKKDKDFPRVIDHWFDTWQYGAVGNADVLGVRLLQDLTERIRAAGQADDMALFRAADSVFRAAKAIAPGLARAVAVGATNTATGGVIDGETLAGALGGNQHVPIGKIRDCFDELVQQIVGQKGRVVVFIDDLDRIRPGRAVALLEILKNFMDVDDTVFVVACDYDVVQEGVKELMGIEKPEKVRAFFHKIFQVPFEMPSASYSVQPLLSEWLEGKVGKGGMAAELAANTSPLLEAALGTNPRSFKRFLNTVDLHCAVDAAYPKRPTKAGGRHQVQIQDWEGGVHRWVASMFGMFALQTAWPEVADYLLYDVLGERAPERATRRFEQALRTLSGDWTDWRDPSAAEDADEEGQEQPDEHLEAILRRLYAGGDLRSDWQRHPKVEQLADFAGMWFAALDRQAAGDGSNTLDKDELSMLWRWSQRTVAQRGSGASRWGKWAFMEEARHRSYVHADAFLGLLDSVEQWTERAPRLAPTYGKQGLTVRLESQLGRAQPFIKFQIDKNKLFIKVRATEGEDQRVGWTGVAALGEQLRRGLADLGFQPYDRYNQIHVDFARGHIDGGRPGSKEQMDRLMLLFKGLVDGTAGLEPLTVEAEVASASPSTDASAPR